MNRIDRIQQIDQMNERDQRDELGKEWDRLRSEAEPVPVYAQKPMRREADRSGVRTRIPCGRCRSAG